MHVCTLNPLKKMGGGRGGGRGGRAWGGGVAESTVSS